MNILVSMIFCHIVDDYILQGCLANLKQKQWWIDNHPKELYKYDYIMVLFIHSFSWSFMIVLIPMLLGKFNIYIFITNLLIHMFVDDLKANKLKINLITDQSIHLLQIIITWLILF